MKPEGLPRGWRLTRTSDLTAVLRSGCRRRTPRMDICWRANDLGHPRFGLIVPLHGNTHVARNLLRRRLREIARREILPSVPSVDLVIRSKPPAHAAGVNVLRADLKAWARTLTQ